jgi:hypothetical protein
MGYFYHFGLFWLGLFWLLSLNAYGQNVSSPVLKPPVNPLPATRPQLVFPSGARLSPNSIITACRSANSSLTQSETVTLFADGENIIVNGQKLKVDIPKNQLCFSTDSLDWTSLLKGAPIITGQTGTGSDTLYSQATQLLVGTTTTEIAVPEEELEVRITRTSVDSVEAGTGESHKILAELCIRNTDRVCTRRQAKERIEITFRRNNVIDNSKLVIEEGEDTKRFELKSNQFSKPTKIDFDSVKPSKIQVSPDGIFLFNFTQHIQGFKVKLQGHSFVQYKPILLDIIAVTSEPNANLLQPVELKLRSDLDGAFYTEDGKTKLPDSSVTIPVGKKSATISFFPTSGGLFTVEQVGALNLVKFETTKSISVEKFDPQKLLFSVAGGLISGLIVCFIRIILAKKDDSRWTWLARPLVSGLVGGIFTSIYILQLLKIPDFAPFTQAQVSQASSNWLALITIGFILGLFAERLIGMFSD